MANERLDRFTKLLKEIFELDKSDLDFGIYRVMNLRKTQIEEFLTQRLPQMVQETLAPFAQGSKEEIRAQMAEIETNAAQFGMEAASLPENNPMGQKYRALQKQLAEGADLSALETDVYSALYSFFNRYYEDGDFISKRRYKEGVYAIPYEGEEVKLYWANQDQYYIKTSENFKDYTFVFDGITVHFRLVDATTEQNNNKESKDTKRTFQYIALLFTEMYLDRYFSNAEGFCAELNEWLEDKLSESMGQIDFQPYTIEKMNKLAFMCATGSGKTLIILFYLYTSMSKSARRRLNVS